MSNTAPSKADPVVVFPLGRWCPPQETSQPHPPLLQRKNLGSHYKISGQCIFSELPAYFFFFFWLIHLFLRVEGSLIKLPPLCVLISSIVCPRVVPIQHIRQKFINSNLMKPGLSMKSSLVAQSFVKFCTEHDSITVVLCAKFQNDWATEKYSMGKQDFSRLEFDTGLGGMSYIETAARVQQYIVKPLMLQLHLHSRLNTWQDKKHSSFGIWCDLY